MELVRLRAGCPGGRPAAPAGPREAAHQGVVHRRPRHRGPRRAPGAPERPQVSGARGLEVRRTPAPRAPHLRGRLDPPAEAENARALALHAARRTDRQHAPRGRDGGLRAAAPRHGRPREARGAKSRPVDQGPRRAEHLQHRRGRGPPPRGRHGRRRKFRQHGLLGGHALRDSRVPRSRHHQRKVLQGEVRRNYRVRRRIINRAAGRVLHAEGTRPRVRTSRLVLGRPVREPPQSRRALQIGRARDLAPDRRRRDALRGRRVDRRHHHGHGRVPQGAQPRRASRARGPDGLRLQRILQDGRLRRGETLPRGRRRQGEHPGRHGHGRRRRGRRRRRPGRLRDVPPPLAEDGPLHRRIRGPQRRGRRAARGSVAGAADHRHRPRGLGREVLVEGLQRRVPRRKRHRREPGQARAAQANKSPGPPRRGRRLLWQVLAARERSQEPPGLPSSNASIRPRSRAKHISSTRDVR
mmetsp:Transcript_21855/g.67289  ORF Transcript_21855/g.67289 Transcript_21855/m.67289 type:complete len:468 (+) Transcript_21855:848-2251(+)